MNVEGAELYDCLIRSGNRMGVASLVLAGTLAIQNNPPQVLALDTGGVARTVKLPNFPQKGDFIYLVNTSAGAFAITVQDANGVALPTALAIAQGKSALIVCASLVPGATPSTPPSSVVWVSLAGA
jgi:hypothetical protein